MLTKKEYKTIGQLIRYSSVETQNDFINWMKTYENFNEEKFRKIIK